MELTSTNLFLSLASFGNLVLVFLNGMVFVLLMQRLKKVRHQEDQFSKEYGDLIANAHKRASQILETATSQAQDLLNNTKVTVSDLETKLRSAFEGFMEEKTKSFRMDLEKVNTDYTDFMGQLTQTLKGDSSHLVETVMSEARGEIQSFVGRLKEETAQASNRFETELRGEFIKAMDQVKAYREEQLGLVEKTINQIILKVSKLVLPEAISIADHERMIVEALEQAKKEEVLEAALKQ